MWIGIDKYPEGYLIFGYASLYSAGSFYIIGGWKSETWSGRVSHDAIYTLDSKTWKWSLAGKINNPRGGHGAVFIQKRVDKL